MADTLTAVGAAMACIRDALDGWKWRTNDPIVADVAHRVGTLVADHNAYRDKVREWREMHAETAAERDRLAGVIRARHDRLCTADYTARGRHHPSCELYELGTAEDRARARAWPEYAAGHPFCDEHPSDMPSAPEYCYECERDRLAAELSRLRGEVAALTNDAEQRERAAYRWAAEQVVIWPGTITDRDALYRRIAAGPAQPVEGERG